jgi:succinate-acetate transporter protein
LYTLLHHAGAIPGPGAAAGVLGLFLICLGLIVSFLTVAALWENLTLVGVFGCLTVAAVILGIGHLASGSVLMFHVAGWAGLVSAVLAFYAGGALVVNSASTRAILPLGPALSTNEINPAPGPAGGVRTDLTQRLG